MKNKQTSIFIKSSIILLFFVYACNNAGKLNNPTNVAYSFLMAINKQDFEKAKALATPDTKNLIDQSATLLTQLPDSVKKKVATNKITIIGKPVIKNYHATVTYKVNTDSLNKTISLQKREGKWLVQQTKDNDINSEEIKNPAVYVIPPIIDSSKKEEDKKVVGKKGFKKKKRRK